MNLKTRAMALGILLAVPTVSACESPSLGVRGSGDLATESRDVSGFDGVVLHGSGTVRIEVTGTESLTIEAEDNLLEYLTTDVVGRTLELESSRSISPTEEIIYTITAESLESLAISGSGEIAAIGITGSRLDTEINGSGSISAQGIDVGVASIDISGSGGVELSGNAGDLDLSISGSGDFEGAGLTAMEGEVSVSGSGDAIVNVTDRLDAEVSGSGNIRYLGDPNVNADTRGSGSISRG